MATCSAPRLRVSSPVWLLSIVSFLSIFVLTTTPREATGAVAARGVRSDWELWKERFGKQYRDAEEDAIRYSIWSENVKHITNHNIEYELRLQSFALAQNKWTDMTKAEYLSKVLLKSRHLDTPLNYDASIYEWDPSLTLSELPPAVDWRKEGCVSPVRNSGECAGSWAVSPVESLEGVACASFGPHSPLSVAQVEQCTHGGDCGCAGGCSVIDAYEYIKDISAEGHFLDLEACYPTTAGENCSPDWRSQCFGARIDGYLSLGKRWNGNETALAAAVAAVGPISVLIDAGHPSFQLYQGGIYEESQCSSTLLDHAVVVIGYGSTPDGKDYWIVKNSWGSNWGEEGFIRMARNKGNQCGIATAATFPLVLPQNRETSFREPL